MASVAIAPAIHAQPQDALEVAKQLVVRSGLAVQLQSLPGLIESEIAQIRGKLPEEIANAIGQASLRGFQPAELQEKITHALAQKMPVAEMRSVIAWLETDVGLRVTRAEEQSALQMTPEKLQAHAESVKRKPLSRKRTEQLLELMKVTKAVESTVTIVESIGLGVAVGLDAMQPAQNRLGIANLRRRIREAMPPEKIREAVSETLPLLFSYTYRDLSEQDLAAYLAFNNSALGVRYTESAMNALADALARASVRVGQLMDEALKRKST